MSAQAKLVLLGMIVGAIGCSSDAPAVSVAADAVKGGGGPRIDAQHILLEHAAGTSFGRRIAAATDLVAVTSAEEPAVYVYDRHAGQWRLGAIVPSPEGHTDTIFGEGLAIAPGVLVVGEPLAEGGGRAHVFGNAGAGWVLEATLHRPDDDYTGFGMSVALDGDRLLVAAPGGAGGAVFAYRRSGGAWIHEQTLTPDAPRGTECFGRSIAASGGVAVVGAPQTHPPEPGWSYGVAYVFELGPTGWVKTASFTEGPAEDGGPFAEFVTVRDGVIVATCHCFDGEAYVYERVDGAWTLVAILTIGGTVAEWTFFSHEVVVSNGHILVGVPYRDLAMADVGTVMRWMRTASGWVADGVLATPAPSAGQKFGHALAADGEMVVVAANPADSTIPMWIFPRGAR
jgi:hypothetical protein